MRDSFAERSVIDKHNQRRSSLEACYFPLVKHTGLLNTEMRKALILNFFADLSWLELDWISCADPDTPARGVLKLLIFNNLYFRWDNRGT